MILFLFFFISRLKSFPNFLVWMFERPSVGDKEPNGVMLIHSLSRWPAVTPTQRRSLPPLSKLAADYSTFVHFVSGTSSWIKPSFSVNYSSKFHPHP